MVAQQLSCDAAAPCVGGLVGVLGKGGQVGGRRAWAAPVTVVIPTMAICRRSLRRCFAPAKVTTYLLVITGDWRETRGVSDPTSTLDTYLFCTSFPRQQQHRVCAVSGA